MYKCEICGVVFDKPIVRQWTEDLTGEGHLEKWRSESCPICGEGYFHEIEEEEDEE